MKPKFERTTKRLKGKDERGLVQVGVVLIQEGRWKHKKGNITRSLTVRNAKVSEVIKAIEEALF